MPPATIRDQDHKAERFTDEPSAQWHPTTLSDRKLIELRQRLVKVHRLGGPFAYVDFSPQAQKRLKIIL